MNDAAVLFSDRYQKLFSFNQAAAFFWSCIEEELRYKEIVLADKDSFRVSLDTAECDTDSFLKACFSLGILVADYNSSHEPEIENRCSPSGNRDLRHVELSQKFTAH